MTQKKLLLVTSNEIEGTINNDKQYLFQNPLLDAPKKFPEECSGLCGMATKEEDGRYSICIYGEDGHIETIGPILCITTELTDKEDIDEWNKESVAEWPDQFTLLATKEVADSLIPILSPYLTVNVLFSDKKLGRADTEDEKNKGTSCCVIRSTN